MNILRRLKAAGCRVDGVTFNPDGTVAFVRTNANGAWTEAQQQAVLQCLGFVIPKPSPQGLCNSVNAFRDGHLKAGYVDATTGKTYQCDPVSVTYWSALTIQANIAMIGNALPLPQFTIIAADNSEITLSATDCHALFSSRVMPWIQSVMFYARNMKNNILSGNPPADITAGWP